MGSHNHKSKGKSSKSPTSHLSTSYSSSDSDLSIPSGASATMRHSLDSRPAASVEVLRCLRCARVVEVTSTDDAESSGMVRIGQNLYYCLRCAKMTGYK